LVLNIYGAKFIQKESKMLLFSGTFYVVKGRVKEFLGTTQMGCEKDQELDQQESSIVPVLEKLVTKIPEIKKTKNAVFFVEFEDIKWLESSKSFKQEPKFVKVKKLPISPANFNKFNKLSSKLDEKDSVSDKTLGRCMSLIGL
jgi:hypothetical protein